MLLPVALIARAKTWKIRLFIEADAAAVQYWDCVALPWANYPKRQKSSAGTGITYIVIAEIRDASDALQCFSERRYSFFSFRRC
jgi:hypothetical protein